MIHVQAEFNKLDELIGQAGGEVHKKALGRIRAEMQRLGKKGYDHVAHSSDWPPGPMPPSVRKEWGLRPY